MRYRCLMAVIAGVMANHAAAFSWTDAGSFPSPDNVDNQCSRSQENGYDWADLQPGAFSTYGTNSFTGFLCSNSFGKRDVLSQRGFQTKCITGGLDQHPSIFSSYRNRFSIDQMQVLSSHNVDIDCEYGMPDGSTCRETHSCSKRGSIFTNSQCGGAVSVTFKPARNAPPGCTIGLHSISFHCRAPSSTLASSTLAPSTDTSSTDTSSTDTSSTLASSITASRTPSSWTFVPPTATCHAASCNSSSVHSTSLSSTTHGCHLSSCNTNKTVTPPTSSASSSLCFGTACFTSTLLNSSATSVAPPCYGDSCSSLQTISSYGSPSNPDVSTSSSSAPASYPTPNCPGLLPRCLNTWLYMSGCKDNADPDCFCGNQEFIRKTMECIGAWTTSDDETQAAASYLMGLCASHISTNPAIITACPSTIAPAPSPTRYEPSAGAVTTTPLAPGKPAPCTTITYSSSMIIPATFTTGISSGLTCPGSSITTTLVTTVTVPRVQITTNTVTVGGTTTQSVWLGVNSPASIEASVTAGSSTAPFVYTSSAGAVPTGYGTAIGTGWTTTTASVSASPIKPATGSCDRTRSSVVDVLIGAIIALASL